MRYLLVIAALLLAACTPLNFKKLKPGRFSGSVIVLWLDGGLNESSGDGKFVYIPTPGDALRFTRPDGTVLKPGVIYTDGGSIPRVVQVFKGFNPWGYAPAYVLHDWLFVARRCLTDGDARTNEKIVAKLKFIDSAEVMGEAMKALKAQQKISDKDFASASVISEAVAGPISKALWNKVGGCAGDRLTKDDDKRVKEYLARFRPVAKGLERAQIARPSPQGIRLVAQIGF